MNSTKILIIGANSDIAMACAEQYKLQGCKVVLAGHKPKDLPLGFDHIAFDVTQRNYESLLALNADIVMYAAGRFAVADTWTNPSLSSEIMEVNFTSAVHVLNAFAVQFKERKHGTIVGISSVAAIRGKQSTIIYGASKAGFDSYLSGLRAMLLKDKVRVLTVRPGFVATKMTKELPLSPLLTAQPANIAKFIVKHSLSGKRNIIYYKPVWRLIMGIIKRIPEAIFKRLKL